MARYKIDLTGIASKENISALVDEKIESAINNEQQNRREATDEIWKELSDQIYPVSIAVVDGAIVSFNGDSIPPLSHTGDNFIPMPNSYFSCKILNDLIDGIDHKIILVQGPRRLSRFIVSSDGDEYSPEMQVQQGRVRIGGRLSNAAWVKLPALGTFWIDF